MKISIAYLPEEEREANIIRWFVHGLCPGEKIRKSDRNPPYLHLYLTTKKPEKPCKYKKKA